MAQKKAVFIILDGIPADVVESTDTPNLDAISADGGYTRAYLGGEAGGLSESPTISAVGYNTLLTGTWANKHNVYGNSIKNPNYHYQSLFQIVEAYDSSLVTAIYSTWLDNRTKLVGDGLSATGNIKIDIAYDGFEHDTVNFPHDKERLFIYHIDEEVSTRAAQSIKEEGPDLSWVYLEYTDDIGHKFGDSPQMIDAVQKADRQVGRIWEAIQKRQKVSGEEWLVIVTTDHGRDAETGLHHGGQTQRERTIWISTNLQNLNERFSDMPAMVDLAPTILRYLEIPVPESVDQEMDGVPLTGTISLADLRCHPSEYGHQLQWESYQPAGEVEIYASFDNLFATGKSDAFVSLGKADVSDLGFSILNHKLEGTPVKFLVKGTHSQATCLVK